MDAARRKAIHDAMVRLSDGDRTAFDVLLDELWPVILAFAKRGAGPGVDAEDVAQEVFYKLCARIADFDRRRDAVSWAFGIASYELMTHRRRILR
ncbi:MAG TPA: sigma-70 family RNA polymerase sigma factor, partial [Polyangiaceae bacterium]|nr:sigma-70 family RNA polymerase sigma factor [Polyangiaceae bacterium]